MAFRIPQVFAGQEDLRRGVVIGGKELVVDIHELALSDGCRGLLSRHVCGALPQVEFAHSHADGTGGNQDDFMPGIFDIAEHLAQRFDMPDIQAPRSMGQG